PESDNFKNVLARLTDASTKIKDSYKRWQTQQQAQKTGGSSSQQTQPVAQQPQQPAQQPAQQPPQQQQQVQPQQQQQPAQQVQAQQPVAQQQAQPQAQKPVFSPAVQEYVSKLQLVLPPEITEGTPEAEQAMKQMRMEVANAMHRREQIQTKMQQLKGMIDQQKAKGQEIPPTVVAQQQTLANTYNQSKNFVEEFKSRQEVFKRARQGSAAQVKMENPSSATMPPNSQPFQLHLPPDRRNQQAQNQPSNAPAVNPAIGNAANANRTSLSPATQQQQQQQHPAQPQQVPQQNQPPSSFPQTPQTMNAPSLPMAMPPQQHPQGMQHPHIPRPHLNMQQPGQPMGTGQQSPQYGQPQPQAYTHQQAMNAARQNSNAQQTPQSSMGLGYNVPNQREQLTTQKMPIPKNLNVPPPMPVNMGPARPTMGGPSNGAPGMMGQPAIARAPNFVLEGEGDRVLSKKKLDELVRQVTGGGEGLGGEGLTPEVEEAMLQLADVFVDELITAACKLAKLRDS
ncbi:hypothetical protein LTS18_012657, partial [Coniosporium uncinatum]